MTSRQSWSAVGWSLLLLLLLEGADAAPVQHDELDAVERLLVRYAPLLYLHPEERWLPDAVATFLGGVRLRDGDGRLRPLVNGSLPVGPDSERFHLVADVPTGLGTPNVQYEPFLGGSGPAGVPVYVTVSRCGPLTTNSIHDDPAPPSFHATYWTFHPFNEGKEAAGRLRGNHVGDWEHLSISVKDGQLTEMFLSAHEFGAYYTYSPDTNTYNFTKAVSHGPFTDPEYPPHVEMDGTHPVLYVARSSHGLWPTPDRHVYSRLPALADETARGAAWRSWQSLVLLGRAAPQWLQYRGRWGNPADCWHLVSAFCGLNSGPRGVAHRRADFSCSGRPPGAARSWWRRLFGRRRRRRAAGRPL